jgi:hypothetical protein
VYFERDWFYVMLALAIPTIYCLIFWMWAEYYMYTRIVVYTAQ